MNLEGMLPNIFFFLCIAHALYGSEVGIMLLWQALQFL
jgi:hypothetical protein